MAESSSTGFAFDVTNPRTVAWAKKHAAELIEGISKATRKRIRDLIVEGFEEEYDVDEIADRIHDVIDDEARAETIARTEVIQASNQGQQEAWAQAVDNDLLTGDEQKEWITTPDDRLCPTCEEMDGKKVYIWDDFDVETRNAKGEVTAVEQYTTPPAHPNCRCAMGIAAPPARARERAAGGPGSGNFGHGGRPGEVGGSSGALSAGDVGKILEDQFEHVSAREAEKEFGALANTTRHEAEFLRDKFVVSDTFQLMDIPLEAIAPIGHVVSGATSKTTGPIVVDKNKGSFGRGMYGAPPRVVILDGKHRYAEAKARGETTIRAYVGDQAAEFLPKARLIGAGGRGSGNFDHAGRPGEVGGSEPGTGGGTREERVARAQKAHKPFTKEKDEWAAKNETVAVAMLRGERTDDNSPVDVVIDINGKTYGVEVKTMLDNSNDKVTVRSGAMDRKHHWAHSKHASLHTLVFDDRKAFGEHSLYSGHRLYYRRGVGSFRLGTMIPVDNAEHLRELMDL